MMCEHFHHSQKRVKKQKGENNSHGTGDAHRRREDGGSVHHTGSKYRTPLQEVKSVHSVHYRRSRKTARRGIKTGSGVLIGWRRK